MVTCNSIRFILFVLFTILIQNVIAQDSAKQKISTKSLFDSSSNVGVKSATPVIVSKDSVSAKPKHDPRKATIRSAILPGWGQAYNHEYWKIPIVYGALGVTAGFFIYNNNWYHRTKSAFDIVLSNDTSREGEIYYKLKGLDAQSLQYYRNQFRKDRDYSVLYFLLAWGLNVVDATVFGHLKDFDVSDDISMHIQPGYNPQTKTPGVGFVFNLKTPPHKILSFGN